MSLLNDFTPVSPPLYSCISVYRLPSHSVFIQRDLSLSLSLSLSRPLSFFMSPLPLSVSTSISRIASCRVDERYVYNGFRKIKNLLKRNRAGEGLISFKDINNSLGALVIAGLQFCISILKLNGYNHSRPFRTPFRGAELEHERVGSFAPDEPLWLRAWAELHNNRKVIFTQCSSQYIRPEQTGILSQHQLKTSVSNSQTDTLLQPKQTLILIYLLDLPSYQRTWSFYLGRQIYSIKELPEDCIETYR